MRVKCSGTQRITVKLQRAKIVWGHLGFLLSYLVSFVFLLFFLTYVFAFYFR
jgi:hypothetical protein